MGILHSCLWITYGNNPLHPRKINTFWTSKNHTKNWDSEIPSEPSTFMTLGVQNLIIFQGVHPRKLTWIPKMMVWKVAPLKYVNFWYLCQISWVYIVNPIYNPFTNPFFFDALKSSKVNTKLCRASRHSKRTARTSLLTFTMSCSEWPAVSVFVWVRWGWVLFAKQLGLVRMYQYYVDASCIFGSSRSRYISLISWPIVLQKGDKVGMISEPSTSIFNDWRLYHWPAHPIRIAFSTHFHPYDQIEF